LGYHAKTGAWLLVLFLVPVTLAMHNFWDVPDPAAAQIQQIMFTKNLALLGCALFIAYFGSGPLSLDDYIRRHAGASGHDKRPAHALGGSAR
jgi:putative oxidoreductase